MAITFFDFILSKIGWCACTGGDENDNTGFGPKLREMFKKLNEEWNKEGADTWLDRITKKADCENSCVNTWMKKLGQAIQDRKTEGASTSAGSFIDKLMSIFPEPPRTEEEKEEYHRVMSHLYATCLKD